MGATEGGADKAPPSFFEVVEEYFGVCVGTMHISPRDFWELTPQEASVITTYYTKHSQSLLDNVSLSVYTSVGKALGGKKWEPIFNRGETANTSKNLITKEAKEAELNYLKNLFNKGGK